VEYKRFYKYRSPTTLLGLEIPVSSEEGGKLYPLPILSEQAKAQKYLDAMPAGVFSIGLHGSYQYKLDIAPSFEQLFDLMEKI
jgi:UDP-galactopyranose mutase